MRLLAIDHVQIAIPTGGEDAARAFYGTLLELPEVEKPAFLRARGGAWFERGSLKVHVGVQADFVPARKAHPAFVVDGLEQLVASLRGNGLEVRDGEPVAGVERAFVDDPFGNRIELMAASPTV